MIILIMMYDLGRRRRLLRGGRGGGPGRRGGGGGACGERARRPGLRDFKDTASPFFESDTLFLECCLFCVVFSCLAILRIEECLNTTL